MQFRLIALIVVLTNPSAAFAQFSEHDVPVRPPVRIESPTMPNLPSPITTVAPYSGGGGPPPMAAEPETACKLECERDRDKCPDRNYTGCPIGDGCMVCK